MTDELINEFIDECIQKIEENSSKVIACLGELDESETWNRPNPNSNSAGNLVLHLCGNMRQYVVASLGKIKDIRERDKEFSANGGYTRSELTELLQSTVDKVKETIRQTNASELLRKRLVQGFALSGMGIIIHVTEHFSYHTGQIIFWTKLLKNRDLGFYKGIDLNTKNES